MERKSAIASMVVLVISVGIVAVSAAKPPRTALDVTISSPEFRSMGMVLARLVAGSLLLIGLLIVGILIERTINRRADAAFSSSEDYDNDRFATWVRSLALGNPRLLAVILGSPTQLCYIIDVVLLVFFVLPIPQPQPVEVIGTFLFLMLFAPSLFWLSNVIDRAKGLRKEADKLKQKASDWEIH
jgi:hypothetical protein